MPTTHPTPTTDRDPSRGAARSDRGGDRAFALVWFALVLTVLIGVTGAAVDVWTWWYSGNLQQRAADAGALAGVVHLPADEAAAQAAILDVVGANDYDPSDVTIETRTQDPTLQANEVRVTVTDRPDTRFLSLLGVGRPTVRRSAVAEYVSSLPMGSPEAYLGRDPERGFDPGYWISIQGRGQRKVQGDRYQARGCPEGFVYACSSNVSDEYDENGYFFAVELESAPTGDLVVEVYDPVHTETGEQDCTNTTYLRPSTYDANKAAIAAQMAALGVSQVPDRYAPGDTIWCQGDVSGGTNPSAGNQNVTTFIVREPNATNFSDLDNPTFQSIGPFDASLPSHPASSCTKQFRALDLSPGGSSVRSIYEILNQTGSDPVAEQVEGAYAQQTYRRWVSLCRIPQATVSNWYAAGLDQVIIQVRSNADLGSPLTASSASRLGMNHFAFRAGYGSATGGGVSIAARGRLPIHNGADGASTTEFFLTRVLPGNAGRTLSLEFWDVADASQPASFRIVAPPDATPSTFTNCSFTRFSGNLPPVDLSASASGCTLNNVTNAQYNGRMVRARVKVPDSYTCNVASSTGCWVRVRVTYGAGGKVYDHTTWDADVVGEPVRLIE